MKRWLNKYKAWRCRRELHSLVQWERTRAKGKTRYVWRGALDYCLIIIPTVNYYSYFFEGTTQSWQSASFWMEAARYFLTGAFIAYVNWGGMEFKYNKARMRAN